MREQGILNFEIAKASIQQSIMGSYPGFDELLSDSSTCSHSRESGAASGQVLGAARMAPAVAPQSQSQHMRASPGPSE